MSGLSKKASQAGGFPASPCIDVCKLNDKGVCIGCKRSISEIVRWSAMTAEEQWRVVNALPERQI